MINIAKRFILLFLGFLFFASAKHVFAQKTDTLTPKNVLVLFSLEPNLPFYDNIISGLKDRVSRNFHHPVNYYMDFIELSRFNDETHLNNFFEFYNKKYTGTKFDLFISVGPGLFPLVKKFKIPVAESIPVIYFELFYKYSFNSQIVPGKNESVIFCDFEFEKNIKFALDLLPGTKNIFVASGSSDADQKTINAYKIILESSYDKYNITYFSGLSISELSGKLSRLPENSIVFLPVYLRDSIGNSYFDKDVVKELSVVTKAPIFSVYDVGIESIVGGYLIRAAEIGDKLGEVSVRILNGESPESIGTYHSNFSEFMFNWNQLNKWKINEKSLPEGSIIINREYTIFEKYYTYIFAALLFIIIETLLLIYIFLLYKKQKKLALIINQQENRYKNLVDFDRLTAVSELTASLSHQLNQPLTAILSTSQASLRFLKNDKYEKALFEEILGNIVEDVKRATEIMSSLRGMIKKETRERKRVSINKIANDVIIIFSGHAAIRDIIVETQYDKSEPFVYADPVLIQQVILNLFMNALDVLESTDKKNKKIQIKTEIFNGYINISVADNGPGIQDSIKHDILKPFFTTKKSGLGIGLAICRSIIEDHNGRIQFQNNKSGGAEFTFNLKIFDEKN